MKIWYQSYTPIGFDSRWKPYEDDLKSYVAKVTRPGTEVHLYGVTKLHPKVFESEYIQQLHIPQIIDNALRAQREEYDVFCLGGTLDLGYAALREVLDIPVAFIGESSFHAACLVARKFGIIGQSQQALRRKLELVKFHGLESRCCPGVYMESSNVQIIEMIEREPQRFIDTFTAVCREAIGQGAGALVPGFGAIGAFLGKRGIHDIDGIPIIDIVAVLIKTAEMLVDLHRLGLKRSRQSDYNYASREDIMVARTLYGA